MEHDAEVHDGAGARVDAASVPGAGGPGLGDRRQSSDRRGGGGDRRQGPRRRDDVGPHRSLATVGHLGTLAAGLAFAVGAYALTHAPISRRPTACGDSLGAQAVLHRSLSPWWFVAILLGVFALAAPTGRHRSRWATGLVGLTLGLGIASMARVGSWTSGLCLA
jgi:hypothetical protein